MSATSEAIRDGGFVASKEDFVARMTAGGWGFWRGMVLGFLAGFPFAYIAVHGELIPGIL